MLLIIGLQFFVFKDFHHNGFFFCKTAFTVIDLNFVEFVEIFFNILWLGYLIK